MTRTFFMACVFIAGISTSLYALVDSSDKITGKPRVIDGDTLAFSNGGRVRIGNIDAPEIDQTCREEGGYIYHCGEAATTNLTALIFGELVTCRKTGVDVYKRIVADCYARQLNLGEEMVRSGWAVSDKRYVREESYARYNNRGIWRGTFDLPWIWRKNHRK